jgi:hypothetical protein
VLRLLERTKTLCLVSAAACALLGFTWQALKVHYLYSDNWTALFCTGGNFTLPPSLAWEHIYAFPNSAGYDGQFYHYVAHDPLLRTDISKYIDAPRLRYRRILLPALAYFAALGRQTWIDRAYIAVHLLFVFLGAWWLARYLGAEGRSPWWAVLFVFVPGVTISLDRLTVDTILTAFAAGFALYVKLEHRWRLYLLLVAAALSRDTGAILIAAYCIYQLVNHRFTRGLLFATAIVPTAAWYLFVQSKTEPFFYADAIEMLPFRGILSIVTSPVPYPFPAAINVLVTTLDYLVVLGMLWVFASSVRLLITKRPLGAIEIALILWTIAGICFPRTLWDDCCGIGRVFSPMLVLRVMRDAAQAGYAAIPVLLVGPRSWIQLGSEALRLIRAIARSALGG